MGVEQEAAAEVFAFVARWERRTVQILREQIKRLNIGVNEELFPSVLGKTYELAAAEIGMDLSFLTHGRFRDMGVGRGRSGDRETRETTIGGIIAKVESQDTNGKLINRKRGQGGRFVKGKQAPKGRKPAKWYSRAFYGRLNALQGAVGAKMVEKAVQAVQQAAGQVGS